MSEIISLAPLTLFKTYGDRKIIGNVVLWLFSGNLGLACILVEWLVRNISNLGDYTQFRHWVAKITESLCFWLIYKKRITYSTSLIPEAPRSGLKLSSLGPSL